ncbi:hypothetical protein FACS189418_0140 [Clostridia bacterium]|nr:hypothetical protein FACS189418_0140 [Clostridia bacterium]
MSEKQQFNETVETLFKGMDEFMTTKTVVGEAIHIGETIVLPLVDVTFGVFAGAFSESAKNNGTGALGGKIMPSSVLVISGGTTKLVNVKNQDGLTKILDMVPDFINRFTKKDKGNAGEAKEEILEEKSDEVKETVEVKTTTTVVEKEDVKESIVKP